MARAIVLPPLPIIGPPPAGLPPSGFAADPAGGVAAGLPVVFMGSDIPGSVDSGTVTVAILDADTGAQIQAKIWAAVSALADARGYTIQRSQVFWYSPTRGL